jgi:hypothetical protein
MIRLLKKIVWDKAGSGIGAEIEYLTREPRPVDSWIIVAPQVGEVGKAGTWHAGNHEFNCISRTRYESRFNVFSTPTHVQFAKWLVGNKEVEFDSPSLKPKVRRGILLFYPTMERNGGKDISDVLPVMGFSLALPAASANNGRIAFRAK